MFRIFLIAVLVAAGFGGQMPRSVSKHLWVGPIALGQSPARVRAILGPAPVLGGLENKVMCYTDGESTLSLHFKQEVNFLDDLVVTGGRTKGCTATIPARYRPMRQWHWAGGIVSAPPDSGKLHTESTSWLSQSAGYLWHFRMDDCDAFVVYEHFGGYSFEMGPSSCH